VFAWNGVQAATAAQQQYVASDHAYSQAMNESAQDDQQVWADGIQQQHINDVNAQVQAAEDAKAAAAAALAAQQAAEAQAAAEAAARQQAAVEAASDDDSGDGGPSGGSSGGSSGAASGTPLPMMQVTDPNNGQYGQMVPSVDPASWCANHSASTINGVPTCD
jgi:membrane protein involved in colicin uptake